MYTFFVWQLLQPFPLLMLLLALGLANLWRKRRETRKRLLLLTVPFLLLTVLSIPAVAHLLRGWVEDQSPPLEQRPDDVEAIVVLSGSAYPADGARGHAELAEDSLYRCLRAVELYRQGKPCPVLVSGGNSDPRAPGEACADVMRDFLLQQGVAPADLIVENQSRSTYENAVESCKLLKERQLHKIVLVTDATHMPRALGCFRKQGVEVVPASCRYRATPKDDSRLGFVPSPSALAGCQQVCHEWLGSAWYRLRGRI
jgi:uncharacterized SAM-binding protein YcdF (DUF218 family)